MSGLHSDQWVREALLLIILALFVVLVASRFTDLATFLAVLSTAKWGWVAVAVVTHLAYFVAYAYMYQYAFTMLGVAGDVGRLLTVFFAAVFVNAVAPLGGVGGAVLFVDDAVRRGQSWVRTSAAVFLVLVVDLLTSVPFIVLGLVYLNRVHGLALYDVIGAAIYLFVVFCLLSALLVAYLSPWAVSRILGQIWLTTNWFVGLFHHPEVISVAWIDSTTAEFVEAARAIASQPAKVLGILAIGILVTLINLVGLFALFLAFGVQPTFGIVAAGFGMSVVYFVIAIFEGIGVVEFVMTLVFVSAGIPPAQAIVISLGYRGLNFWLPLIVGLYFVVRAPTFRTAHRR